MIIFFIFFLRISGSFISIGGKAVEWEEIKYENINDNAWVISNNPNEKPQRNLTQNILAAVDFPHDVADLTAQFVGTSI